MKVFVSARWPLRLGPSRVPFFGAELTHAAVGLSDAGGHPGAKDLTDDLTPRDASGMGSLMDPILMQKLSL
jgi:hypothetical protein